MSDRIRHLLAAGVSAGAFRGASWQVEARGALVDRGAVGECDLATPFDLASLTKPLAIALLALFLDREGKLDIEAPARGLLPELAGTPYDDVTILDLGLHRSGLPAWRALYLRGSDRDAFVRAIAEEPPAASRGSTVYSDLGYILLGAAVERAAGVALGRLFDLRIASPLGISLGFRRPGNLYADAAPTEEGNSQERELAGPEGRSYAWRTESLPGVVHDENARVLGGVAGHAGLFGNADEVTSIAREMLEPGKLPLDSSRREFLLRPQPPSGRSFGMVSAAESETVRDVLPKNVVGHFGFTGTSLWIDPVAHRIYVLLTNRVHPGPPGDDIKPVRREFHRLAAAIPEP